MEYTEDWKYVYPENEGRIEKQVIKYTISPKTFNKQQIEKIIFPYFYNKNNELIRYDTNTFEKNFKGACNYLRNFKKN